VPASPCPYPGCADLVDKGSCAAHGHALPQKFADKARGRLHQQVMGPTGSDSAIRCSRTSHYAACAKRRRRVTMANSVDHMVTKAGGGTDDPSNLRPLCERHHRPKTSLGSLCIEVIAFPTEGW
jgi:5-methylcytosine-specific restriction enzyme A